MSKFMFFDFQCEECKHTFEDFVKPSYRPPCPECQGKTIRLVSSPTIALSGTDPGFPGEYEKWERKRKQKAAEDKKFYDDHGVNKKHHSYGS